MDECRIVDSRHRVEGKFPRCDDLAEIDGAHALEDVFGAYRAFERRDELSAVEFGAGVAQGVFFAVNGQHDQMSPDWMRGSSRQGGGSKLRS